MDGGGSATCYLHSKILQEPILLHSIRAGLQIPNSNGNTPTAFTACNGTRLCWFSSSRPLSDTRNGAHAQTELMPSSLSAKCTALDNVPATKTHVHGPAAQSKSSAKTRSRRGRLFTRVCACRALLGGRDELTQESESIQKQSVRYWGLGTPGLQLSTQ